MITLFQIDKAGSDLFEKDYSIVVVVDQHQVYGVNIPQKIKDDLNYQFKNNLLRIQSDSDKKKKNRFRLRFHTAVVLQLLKKAISDLGHLEEVNIQMCNDFDGHFNEIKDMIYKNIHSLVPSLKPENIISVKFSKPSKIDEAGKAFRNKDKNKLKEFIQINLNSEEIINIVKK